MVASVPSSSLQDKEDDASGNILAAAAAAVSALLSLNAAFMKAVCIFPLVKKKKNFFTKTTKATRSPRTHEAPRLVPTPVS